MVCYSSFFGLIGLIFSVRDEFEAKRADLEGQVTKLLGGEAWKIEVDPNLVYAYAEEDSYGRNSLGDCISAYINGAIYRLKYFLESHGAEGAAEINELVPARVLTLVPDVEKKNTYGGVEIKDGQLRILFAEGKLGTNVDNCFEYLETGLSIYNCTSFFYLRYKAINETGKTAANNPLSYTARHSIKTEWTPKFDALQKKLATQLHNDEIKLEPNWEANFAALKSGKDVRDDWEGNLGDFTRRYFEALEYYMNYHKFSEDDLLYEGFAESVTKGQIEFKIVEKLSGDSSYNQVLIEDEVCILQTTPSKYGTNIDNIAEKIVDIL
jgi:hypothetical protein